MTNELAMPGDVDLDYNAKNVTLSTVHRQQDPEAGTLSLTLIFEQDANSEVIMLSDDGFRILEQHEDLALNFEFAGIPKKMFDTFNWSDEMMFSLDRWVTEKTLLSLVSSPGKSYTLWEDEHRWVPLPRMEK